MPDQTPDGAARASALGRRNPQPGFVVRRRPSFRFRPATVTAVLALLAVLTVVLPALPPAADAADPTSCSGVFRIDQSLQNGGRWQMCWELRGLEGVVLHDVTYTPPGAAPVEVLAEASVAQIHVPYDDGQYRFHDVSDYGLGNYVNDLQPGDCPEGSLLTLGTVHVLCQQVTGSGYRFKSYAEQAQGTTLSLFSVSHIGAYNYVVAWSFDDDGTIRPEIGATGQLQRFGGTRGTGWYVGARGFAVAHMHNYYWRLDFDINGADDDRVEELAASASSGRQSFTNTRTAFPSEVARRVRPGAFRSWRVLDGTTRNAAEHPISYELRPETDSIFRGPNYEPFTQNEFYVTADEDCERFASHNPNLGGTCGSNLAEFVNGETLVGADLVVWYGTSFRHLPRQEDVGHMGNHWSGFSIQPRDLTAN